MIYLYIPYINIDNSSNIKIKSNRSDAIINDIIILNINMKCKLIIGNIPNLIYIKNTIRSIQNINSYKIT